MMSGPELASTAAAVLGCSWSPVTVSIATVTPLASPHSAAWRLNSVSACLTKLVRLGVVGIGRMGRGVVDQVATMPGMRVMAAADVDLGRAEACLRENGADPVVTDELGPAQDALRRGRPVATADAGLMPQLELDALVEATGLPEVGARVAADAIENRRHVVMLNVETDVVVGPILAERARRAGVVYTLAAGDPPGAIFRVLQLAPKARI